MFKKTPLLQVVCVTFLLWFCGCGGLAGGVPNGSGGVTATVPEVNHVAIVLLENANYGDIVGTSNMPYLQSLMKSGSLVTHYYANSHPSIPNYFMLTTGQPITNLDSYSDTVSTDNVVRELKAAQKTWKVYAESLPSQGYTGGDQGAYLQHHNPISYFSDVRQNATEAANLVDFSQLATDESASTLPNYSFIIPNMINDAHTCPGGGDCSLSSRLATADGWLQTNIAPLLANSSFQSSGLLIVVFDESANDITNGGGHVVAVLAGTHVRPGYADSGISYDHRSMLSLTMKALGVANIPNGADAAPQMTEFFN